MNGNREMNGMNREVNGMNRDAGKADAGLALLLGEVIFVIVIGLLMVAAVSSAVKMKADGPANARRDAYCIQVPEVCK